MLATLILVGVGMVSAAWSVPANTPPSPQEKCMAEDRLGFNGWLHRSPDHCITMPRGITEWTIVLGGPDTDIRSFRPLVNRIRNQLTRIVPEITWTVEDRSGRARPRLRPGEILITMWDRRRGMPCRASNPTSVACSWVRDDTSTGVSRGARVDLMPDLMAATDDYKTWVILHELGHTFGLSHSSVAGSVMAGVSTSYSRDDVTGIRWALFGELPGQPTPTTQPNVAPPPPPPPPTTAATTMPPTTVPSTPPPPEEVSQPLPGVTTPQARPVIESERTVATDEAGTVVPFVAATAIAAVAGGLIAFLRQSRRTPPGS